MKRQAQSLPLALLQKRKRMQRPMARPMQLKPQRAQRLELDQEMEQTPQPLEWPMQPQRQAEPTQ